MSLVGGYPSGAHYYGGTTALHSHPHDFYNPHHQHHHQNTAAAAAAAAMGVGRYQWTTASPSPHPAGAGGGGSSGSNHHAHHQMDLNPQDMQPWVSAHSTSPNASALIPQATPVEHLIGFTGSTTNVGVENYNPQAYGLASYHTHPGAAGHMYNMMGVDEHGKVRCGKRKVSANKKERRRTISINTAFSSLRGCIPNVPTDTKLSKIKTLRLATSYIAYLMDVLNKDDPALLESGFKAEVPKKTETTEERRLAQEKEMLRANQKEDKRSRGRTGWPQAVWASELKTESTPGSGNSSSGEQDPET